MIKKKEENTGFIWETKMLLSRWLNIHKEKKHIKQNNEFATGASLVYLEKAMVFPHFGKKHKQMFLVYNLG